tara:strand:+ start:6046 stop:6417 length:372 start_codon:yes stop_codon:yes gene_type:complete
VNQQQLLFTKGKEILKEGDVSENAYIILEGEVEVKKRMPDGKEKLLATLSENELFGECGLVDSLPRTATCIAKTDVYVATVTKENYAELLKDKPQALIPILRIVIDRLRGTMKFVEDIYGATR